jgi:transcriptional regulator with XRE-family HTH domain
MHTTREFLAAIKAVHALTSDYQLHQKLGVSRQQISKYQSGEDTFGPEITVKVAELLQLEWPYVLACSRWERAKTPHAKRLWETAAKVFSGIALGLLVGCSVLLGHQAGFDITPGIANWESAQSVAGLYIMRSGAALSLLAGSMLCALLLVQLRQTCSARSR